MPTPPETRSNVPHPAFDDDLATVGTSRSTPCGAPSLVAFVSPRKPSDFVVSAAGTAPVGSSPAIRRLGFDAPPSTESSAASLSRVTVRPAFARTVASAHGDKDDAAGARSTAPPFYVFVQDGRYLKANATGKQVSPLSRKEAERLGLPPAPALSGTIHGTIDAVSPTPLPLAKDGSRLVPVTLRDLVQEVPYEREVHGLQFADRQATVVVQADSGRLYACASAHQRCGTGAFRELDPEVPDDQQFIDAFHECRQQLKATPSSLGNDGSFRNIVRHIEQRIAQPTAPWNANATPPQDARDAAYEVFTSAPAQRRFVDDIKASLRRRERFDAGKHEFDISVYRAILGPELVFEADGQWNIGTAAGIADLRTHLRDGNLAFAGVDTAKGGSAVYFALSGGNHKDTLQLRIHDAMGENDEVRIGRVRFVDARRRRARLRADPGARVGEDIQVNLPSLDPTCKTFIDRVNDAEQIIASVLLHDTRDDPVTHRIHVNSLLDTCDACASTLSMLQTATGQSVNLIYHHDYGVKTANSADRKIRAMQRLAATANAIREHLMTGDFPALAAVSRRLPTPDMVEALSHWLIVDRTEFSDAARLAHRSNAQYLRMLASLTRNAALAPHDVTAMLLSPQGRAYVALLGRRVAMHPELASAWASLLGELREAGSPRATLLRVLLSKPEGLHRCFYVELLRAPHVAGDARNALVAWLKSANLIPTPAELPAYVSLRRAVTLSIRLALRTRSAEAPLTFHYVPLKDALDTVRTLLSERIIVESEGERLATKLREVMPTVTIAEQYEFREMIHDAVSQAWKQTLPGTAPPSDIARRIMSDTSPDYRRALGSARRSLVDAVIVDEVQAYAAFQRDHPTASPAALQDEFDARFRSGRAAYRDAVLGSGDSPRDADIPGGEHARASAQAQAAKVTAARSRALARQQANAAARTAQLAADARAASTARESAMASAAHEAREASQREAKRVALEQARQASLAASLEASKQAAQHALEKARSEAFDRAERERRARDEQAAWLYPLEFAPPACNDLLPNAFPTPPSESPGPSRRQKRATTGRIAGRQFEESGHVGTSYGT